jgi:uncharacterized membrane protein
MRYNTLDIIRGASVVGMVIFHANYLLEEVFFRDLMGLSDTFWTMLGRSVAITFIFVSGFVAFLSGR